MFANDNECYAHTNQLIVDHCLGVGDFAGNAADKFGAGLVARFGGTMHDVGKNTPSFQAHLAGEDTPPNYHTHRGAIAARDICERHPNVPRYVVDTVVGVIACHHGGLTRRDLWDKALAETRSAPIPEFDDVFRESMDALVADIKGIDDRLLAHPAPLLLLFVWVRMIYSCVVDGDYLDTESVMDAERSRLRKRRKPVSFAEMRAALDEHVARLRASGNGSAATMRARDLFRDVMLDHAKVGLGIWSVDGPCSVGKTLASLSWALVHAEEHGLSRIIYVLPYNTIADQMFEEMRKIFDGVSATCVIEATSSFELDRDDDDDMTMRLSSENFDAEIVITSSVNFFESLFSNKPSRCRKLHNIANSVVILDEAQRMPVDLLCPTLAMLETLVSDFGCSVLMMSGTLPDFEPGAWLWADSHHKIEDSRLDEVRSLLSGRVRYENIGDVTLGGLCDEVMRELDEETSSVLVVFNKILQTRLATSLFKSRYVGDDGDVHVYCLTTKMKMTHRVRVIKEIRERLARGERVVVFSTSLIEAGIDISFGRALRAWAGLDSIVQVGGRVNRGGLDDQGVVRVFSLVSRGDGDEKLVDGDWMRAEREMALQVTGGDLGRLDDAMVSRYLTKLFYGHTAWVGALESLRCPRRANRLKRCLRSARAKETRMPESIDFREIDDSYQIIKDGTKCLLVPNDADSMACYWKLRNGVSCKIDKHSVSVWPDDLQELVNAGVVEMVHRGVWSIKPEFVDDLYDEFGLVCDVGDFGRAISSEDLVI